MKKILTLAKTELKLSLRSFDAIFFGILMPVIVLVVVGLIFRNRPQEGGQTMIEMTYGAFLSIGICAVGLMALPLVLSDYRSKKILKRFQVTPAHPGMLFSVQLMVQGLMAVISAVVVAVAARIIFSMKPEGSLVALIAGYFLVLISIFSIGMVVAATAKDSKKAGMICSLLYFPMLLFSGTTVPFPVFPEPLRNFAQVFPLRQGIILLNGLAAGDSFRKYPLQIGVLSGIAVVGIIISVIFFKWDME